MSLATTIEAALANALLLDEATTELHDRIVEVEKLFKGLKLGVIASVPLGDGKKLAFGKDAGTWHLIYEDDNIRIPLVNAPRFVRLLAAAQFEALLRELTAAIPLETQKVIRATEQCDELIDELAHFVATEKAST